MYEFMEAAASWADRRKVDMVFARDEFDGWFAIMNFSDARGSFTKSVNPISRKSKKVDGKTVKESDDEYEDRVAQLLMKESAKARQDRINQNVGRVAARAA